MRGLHCYRQGDGHGRRQRASQDESQDVGPAQESRPRNQQAPKALAETRKMRSGEVRDVEVWSSHGKHPQQGRASNVDAVAAAFYSTAAIEF